MSAQVDPQLRQEISLFGGENVDKCFNCGNCTAICPLSRDSTVFPRKIVRYLQLGLKEKVAESSEPWLCYYCGECSETCPRDASPGELMMATRRYLISQYDWTGLSRRLYLSKAWEFGALLIVALFVVVLFILSGSFTAERMVTSHVSLNTFAPVEWIHYSDLALAAILSFLLLSNAYRMYRFIVGRDNETRIPIWLYFQELKTFILHGLTQIRWRECEKTTQWLKHLLLVTAYGTMFILVVLFLPWFQMDTAEFSWTSLLGYYATFIILYVTGDAMLSRFKKKEEIHKYSHLSDWMFLILLFLTALTGILLHLFRIFDFPLPAYYMYVIHLAIAVPMLIVEVPFSKWAHLLYRPLAIYLITVKERARPLVFIEKENSLATSSS